MAGRDAFRLNLAWCDVVTPAEARIVNEEQKVVVGWEENKVTLLRRTVPLVIQEQRHRYHLRGGGARRRFQRARPNELNTSRGFDRYSLLNALPWPSHLHPHALRLQQHHPPNTTLVLQRIDPTNSAPLVDANDPFPGRPVLDRRHTKDVAPRAEER